MAEAAANVRRRRRRVVYVLFAAGALGLAAALAVHHYSRPQRLAELLVSLTREQLGADLVLGGEAGFALVPRLQALLPGPQLVAGGRTLLRADAIAARVPWRTLWADAFEIERVELLRPVLDLGALRAWLGSRPSSDAAMPDVRIALRVVDGSVVDQGRTVVEGIDIDFSNSGDLASWFAALERDAGAIAPLPPARGTASATRLQIGETRLEGLRVELRDDDAPAGQ